MQIQLSDSSNMVSSQLDKILKSETFRESEKLKDFLRFVVEQTIEGKADQLKQYTIAISAFNREEGFEPQNDPIVRIQAGRLRQRLDKYYRGEGKNDTLLIEIPKGSYIPEFSSIDRVSSKHRYNTKILSSEPMIWVFPFKNLSGIEVNQYIADGFSEELIMTLSLFRHLKIIRAPKKSAQNYESQNNAETIPQARFILDGSIRFKNSDIMIIVTLTDSENNEVVWGRKFSKPYELENVIDIQETVAQNVAATIADVYGGVVVRKLYSETPKTIYKDIERYDAILNFYNYLRNPSAFEYEKVVNILKDTIKKHPDFGAGYAALSDIIMNNYALGYHPDAQGLLRKGLDYAKKGVHYDSENQMTRTYLGYAYLIGNQLEDSIQQTNYAKSLNSNSAYYIGALGWVNALAGGWEEGMADIQLSYQLNPDYPKWYHLATTLYYLKECDFDKALQEALKLDLPQILWDPLLKAVSYAHIGKAKEAKIELERLFHVCPDFANKPSFYLGMFIKFEDVFERVIEGLEKAGMSLQGNDLKLNKV